MPIIYQKIFDKSSRTGLMKTQGTPIGVFDPEGLIFAAGIDNSTVKLYDLRTFDKGAFSSWQLPLERSGDVEWTSLEFSKDGQQVHEQFV